MPETHRDRATSRNLSSCGFRNTSHNAMFAPTLSQSTSLFSLRGFSETQHPSTEDFMKKLIGAGLLAGAMITGAGASLADDRGGPAWTNVEQFAVLADGLSFP